MVIFMKQVSLSSEGASTTYTVKLALEKLPANAGNFICSSQVKRPYTQFTCVTCTLPVKTGNYTCFYVASISRRIHAMALNKAQKLQVSSPAGCKLTYLQFAGDITRGVIADCLQLQLILCGIAGFLPAIVRVFFSAFLVNFTCDSSVFACRLHVFLPAEAGNFAC